jgi:hypothetical protein
MIPVLLALPLRTTAEAATTTLPSDVKGDPNLSCAILVEKYKTPTRLPSPTIQYLT